MKIIEALKQIKYLTKKAADIRTKIPLLAADLDIDRPLYDDMPKKCAETVQSHTDIIREIVRLKYRVQKTNIMTSLTIKIGGIDVTKSIYEWIQRRQTFVEFELSGWKLLQDRGLQDQRFKQSNGQEVITKVRRYYDPIQKDKMIEILSEEGTLIDAALEIANCSIDLLD